MAARARMWATLPLREVLPVQIAGHQPQQTVVLRVQVIDMESRTLDLQVPTYLPARDLTQRVARDAGLGAYWDDGRRLFWLRARGRLLKDDENLADLGVIDGELVYLLPEPPAGSGVAEQPPDYPERRGYAGKGTLAVLGALAGTVTFAVAWGALLTLERTSWTVMPPGLGLGFLCISTSRHMWGGQGSKARVAVVGMMVYLMLFVLVFLPGVALGESAGEVYADSISGFIFGIVGIFVGWLSWWGAVEPLPTKEQQAAQAPQEVVATVPCGICGGEVTPEVRSECQYGCGQYFHTGCYQARIAVYRGDPRFCAICSAQVG